MRCLHPAAAATAGCGCGSAAATSPQQSFGLYAAEHPAPPTGSSLSAKVLEIRPGANGHATVVLEGGQVWELEEPDALLTSGDAITIRRAALGSFLMNTAQGRTHRVHRLH